MNGSFVPNPSPAMPAVGDTLPVLRRHATQAMIDAYARASGDFNPIHVDPDYARTGPFGSTIAHGLMTLAFVAQLLNTWSNGAFDDDGELDIAFVSPVYCGDEVMISGQVDETFIREGRRAARICLVCKVADRAILAGTATLSIDGKEGENHGA